MTHSATDTTDVLVAGAGIAGLTAGAALARRGLRVRCIDPTPFPRPRVGESLDWAVPQLLEAMGDGRDEIIAADCGTYKREVHAYTAGGRHMRAAPPSWFRRSPLRFETATLHVDREAFDLHLYRAATAAGVDVIWDRIRAVHMDGDRVIGCTTASGASFRADWYIDATGRSRLIGRAAGVGVRPWGTDRIGIWCHRRSRLAVEGTVLHIDDDADELAWAWEIPIASQRTSVGVVLPLDEFKRLRRRHTSVGDVLVAALARFPEFEPISEAPAPWSRTYRPYVSQRVTGSNWLMAGDAAALVDPLSSAGVTAALRHGTEAAELITRNHGEAAVARHRLTEYDRRVRRVSTLYNDAIQGLIYQRHLRQRLGFKQAGRAYVIVGYLTSALYTRLQPASSPSRDAAMALVIACMKAWTRGWMAAGRPRR